MVWTLGAGPGLLTTDPARQLTAARSRRFTFKYDGAPACSITMNGRHPDGELVIPRQSDVWARRANTATDGTVTNDLMFRGRVVPSGDDIDETRHTTAATAVGYRWILENARQIGVAGRYFAPGTDQGALAWTLVSESQALSAGNLGITNGLGSTSGTTRELTLRAGAKIGEEIAKLGRLDNGFAWEISPTLALNRWYPGLDNAHGVVLDYGGLVSAARLQGPAAYANAVIVTGKEGLTPVAAQHADILTDPRGRWELTESFPTVEQQASLTARAPALVDQLHELRAPWIVTIAQVLDEITGEPTGRSRWNGPAHIWLGDTITFRLQSGRFDFAAPYRIAEIGVDVGDNGSEVVKMGLTPT